MSKERQKDENTRPDREAPKVTGWSVWCSGYWKKEKLSKRVESGWMSDVGVPKNGTRLSAAGPKKERVGGT